MTFNINIENIKNNPAYQKALRKVIDMTPDEKRFVDTAMLDTAFVTDEMRNYLQAFNQAAIEKQREESLLRRGNEFDTMFNLKERASEKDFENRQQALQDRQQSIKDYFKDAEIAEGLGLLNLGLQGWGGMQDLKAKTNIANKYGVNPLWFNQGGMI